MAGKDPSPTGAIVIVHGLGEHCARYDHVATRLAAETGLDVHSWDHLGHGASEGVRGFFSRADELVEDAVGFVELLIRRKRLAEGKKLFVLGHSMGGLIATLLAKRLQEGAIAGVGAKGGVELAGLLLSSPFILVPPGSDNPVVRGAASLLSSLLPSLPVLPLDLSSLADDPSVRSQYEADPLVYHGAVRARVAHELSSAAASLVRDGLPLTVPAFFLVYGKRDRIVNPAGSELLTERISAPSKLVLPVDGLHEVLNDSHCHRLIDELVAFVNRQL